MHSRPSAESASRSSTSGPNSRIVSRVLSVRFRKASRAVGFIFGTVDADLSLGGVGINAGVTFTREILANGSRGYRSEYSAAAVAEAYAIAKRPVVMTWEEASAWAFLRVCKENNLGVIFS